MKTKHSIGLALGAEDRAQALEYYTDSVVTNSKRALGPAKSAVHCSLLQLKYTRESV